MISKVYQFSDSNIALVFSYYAIEKDGVASTASVDIPGAIKVNFSDNATPREIKAVTGLATFNRGKVLSTERS